MRFVSFVRPMFLGLLAVAAMASPAQAALLTIGDTGENSTLTFDTASGNYTNWTVDGYSILPGRAFFWRVGNTDESSVSDADLVAGAQGTLDVNFLPGDDTLRSTWTDAQNRFRISMITTLTAGAVGSNQATYTESIRVDNLSGAALPFTLFLAANYDLSPSSIDDLVYFGDPRSVTQTWDDVVQETSVTILPSAFDATTVAALLAVLTDGLPSTLTNNASISNDDLAYAFQWNFNIAAGKSITLGTTNSVTVPEASSVVLGALAAAGIGVVARRRRGA